MSKRSNAGSIRTDFSCSDRRSLIKAKAPVAEGLC